MISFYNVSKVFRDRRDRIVVLDDASFELPDENVAVLGAGGSGKTTLLRLMCGNTPPDRGRIVRHGRPSWLIGSRVGTNKRMTGAENVRFIARIYGLDSREMSEEVRELSELGDHFYRPLAAYTGNMRSQLMFTAAMVVDFDIYLIDETLAVGDPTFRAKCRQMLHEKSETSQLVIVSEDPADLREFCRTALVIDRGALHYFDDLEEAIAYHRQIEAR